MTTTLRVRARQGIVTRMDLMQHGIRRMVGQRLQAHPEAGNGYAWVPTGETEEIPNRVEFRQAIKDGSLWAADEETAREAFGATWRDHFDPSFGTARAAIAAAALPKTAPELAEHHEIADASAATDTAKETV